jgi:hypothetical protein
MAALSYCTWWPKQSEVSCCFHLRGRWIWEEFFRPDTLKSIYHLHDICYSKTVIVFPVVYGKVQIVRSKSFQWFSHTYYVYFLAFHTKSFLRMFLPCALGLKFAGGNETEKILSKFFLIHQLMHKWTVLKTILNFTLKLILKQLRDVSVQSHHH